MEPDSQITPLPKMPALLLTWRWLYSVSYAIMSLIACGILWLFLDMSATPSLMLIAPLLLSISTGYFGWYYANLYFNHYGAQYQAGYGVLLKIGVWSRNEVWVPIVRLQHIDVHQGPLDRRWGMATLSLYTAGTHENEIRIKGLPVAQAHALRLALLPTERGAHE